ncbi:anti-sigma factor domain-containing protein [Bacillus sp. KH172YL63]|uniref:anti-sigma factor domain-containing protein n=1 Tax=Bacillus sp. KH172YL63 TaxID=2709784 RepID=UPI0013E46591|nr:anti-sigma factor domain-containing protein [Bacillus sp. KH172YL63]BCB03118.1 anti-sigma-I factor RsgI [Bacillus sp. KH172YL63]
MKKGIIMEIKDHNLVMMTPDGEFLTSRKQPGMQYAVGEEIPFFPVAGGQRSAKSIGRWKWKVPASIMTAIIIIVTLLSGSMVGQDTAYAYVSVDINPSMELALNKDQQVISITPYNEDAEKLLKKLYGWDHEEVSAVTEKIFLLSEKMGYLKENQHVLITSSFIKGSDRQKESELKAELNKFAEGFSTGHNANIIMKETSEKVREEASEKGMTAGSFIQQTEEKKDKASVEDHKKPDIKEINEKKPAPSIQKNEPEQQEKKPDHPVKTEKPQQKEKTEQHSQKSQPPAAVPQPKAPAEKKGSTHHGKQEYKRNNDHKSPRSEREDFRSGRHDSKLHDRVNHGEQREKNRHDRKDQKRE